MPPPQPSHPKESNPAKTTPTPTPKNHLIFDPWNSASTGHQRAENGYSNTTAWRETRTEKLRVRFGGPHTSTSTYTNTGTGVDKGNGEWKWISAGQAKREKLGCRDIRSFMGMGTTKSKDNDKMGMGMKSKPETGVDTMSEMDTGTEIPIKWNNDTATPTTNTTPPKNIQGIFTGTTIYINGSTMPLVSDHKLKHLLTSHGARISISLTRRSVTHVIIGRPNNSNNSNKTGVVGAGGGLAGGKLQREIQRVGGRGVRVVGVEWVLESIKASKRLSEARFASLHMASRGQRSVLAMFK